MSKEHFYRPDEALCDTPIPYRACGLDGIWLCNGYEIEEIGGERFTRVKDLEGLHSAIALHLVENRKTLAPKEIRFIRTAMNKTQAEIARMVGVNAEWEAKVKGLLKAELKRRNVSYAQLVEKLDAIGVKETEPNVRNKLSRGKFTAVFLIQCLASIGAKELRLD